MSAFLSLLKLPERERAARGLRFTPAEIAQQPEIWKQTLARLRARKSEWTAFARDAGLTGTRKSVLLLAGAGTSEYIGRAVAPALRHRLKREVRSVPTTALVTHAGRLLVPGQRYTMISFARSGNSPESLAAYRLVRRCAPAARHLVITCNPEGLLATTAQADPGTFLFELPEKANDRSLAMTSSFTGMALAALALGFIGRSEERSAAVGTACRAATHIMTAHGGRLQAFAARPFRRACFLGSQGLYGTMQECQLKMQEMTAGRVACRHESFLGLRHGPQVFIDRNCVVVAALSTCAAARRYELDLLRELRAKHQGCGLLVLCAQAGDVADLTPDEVLDLFPGDEAPDDDFRVLTDVVAGQILALFKSMNLGLKPDAPSPDGTIHRVVQGVRIYGPEGEGLPAEQRGMS